MKSKLENFNKFKPLLSELVTRDVKTKYRKSVLGVLWTLLNPLLMMIILSIVFAQIFRFNIDNYPLYLLSGQVIYNFFSTSSQYSMSAIIDNAPLIKKVYVPKYMFVLSRTVSSVINLLASVAALIIVMLFTRADLYITVLLSAIPLVLLIVNTLGVGLFLAACAAKFRDMIYLYTVITTGLMYLTPVIYPMESLPGWVSKIVLCNPLTSILQMYRDFTIYGTISDWFTWVMATVPSFLLLALGIRVFYKNQDNFILYV